MYEEHCISPSCPYVHEATIQRDLSEIELEGSLKRTHGGVIMEEWTNDEPPFNERSSQNLDQKMRIGKMAASLVEDGDHIIIDSGRALSFQLYVKWN
ncbi:DeoR family transcriptional regulator [Paenibacillus alkaliterrae]|uniref:DeoR family transcriptional regulator n=1 Tax=Paenibacillus alkaliterrae TaxID=320909 RepID=UPI001F1FBB71|nr:DeoR family transcriptional regulator [Paenibacillus alkaliterrae]MCF2941913.1 DeoR family transcriptional regulator [Paenibacillus alkaliterrae]